MRDVLVSVDPARGRLRFFVVELRETARGAELVRRWGRVGTEGRREVFRFATIEGAHASRRALLERRARRGYVATDRDGFERARRELAAHREARRRDSRQLSLL